MKFLREILLEARPSRIDIDKAFEKRRQGMPDRDIAKHFGLKTGEFVTKILEQNSKHPNYHPRQQKRGGAREWERPTKINISDAFKMRKMGMRDKDIAAKQGFRAHSWFTAHLERHKEHPEYQEQNYISPKMKDYWLKKENPNHPHYFKREIMKRTMKDVWEKRRSNPE